MKHSKFKNKTKIKYKISTSKNIFLVSWYLQKLNQSQSGLLLLKRKDIQLWNQEQQV